MLLGDRAGVAAICHQGVGDPAPSALEDTAWVYPGELDIGLAGRRDRCDATADALRKDRRGVLTKMFCGLFDSLWALCGQKG
jgi:hypothetical protein